MLTFNVLEAGPDLSRLVEAVENGSETEIVIARDGKPVARLVPIATKPDVSKRLGLLQGQYPAMSLEDFNSTDGEILKLFYGEEGAKLFQREK